MKNHAKSLANSPICLAASVVFFFTLAAPLRAQGNRTPPQTVIRNAEQDLMSREWNLTHIPDQVDGQFKKEQVSTFHQVQEDFTNIQAVNNMLARCATPWWDVYGGRDNIEVVELGNIVH